MPVRGRRVVVPGPREVTLEAFELDDSHLHPDEAIVRTRYSTISPGTELSIYTALDPGVYDPKAWCHYPFQPGYIAVGEVIACGTEGQRRGDVRRCREGDVVFWFGKHASVQRVNLSGFLLRVPADFDLSVVGLTRMATVAMRVRPTTDRSKSGGMCSMKPLRLTRCTDACLPNQKTRSPSLQRRMSPRRCPSVPHAMTSPTAM